MRVGLTGGIGSGKSEVALEFERCGALLIDTDLLARIAVEPGSTALAEISARWPESVVAGALDRAALARAVFNNDSERNALNAILHPQIRSLAFERERSAAPGQLIVHVVPLLFESDYASLVERTILVIAPLERRLARVMERDAADRDAVLARMRAQIDPERARALADEIIENDGDLACLRERSRALYRRLVAAPNA
ncbi:MAG TPA: dephospho-CoA kinase [Candidatus Dormibacteraeota bacterium]|nr:dephospho-CoA kinase [Candidatus Dormibacteraeota bacterium]